MKPLHQRHYLLSATAQKELCLPVSSLLLLLAVSLPRFVMCQDVFFRLAVQNIPVVIRSVYGFNPVASRVHYLNPYGSSCPAARDQHRRQAYG